MKLLVTGATGFLGSYVVAEAVSRGHSVRAVVRPTSDANQLAYAVSQRKTLLTHNRADFEALAQTYFATG